MQEVKDLISRSTVNKAMKEKHSKWIDKLHNEHDKEIYTMAVRHMLDCVDEVEVAFDVDKVVEQMDKRIAFLDGVNKICFDAGNYRDADKNADKMSEVIAIKEIVRNGGKE